PRPLDGVHADVGAAIDGDDAVAITASAQVQKREQERNVARIVGGIFQDLVADAEAGIIRPPDLVEAVDDHRAVFGRGEDEGDLAGRIAHRAGVASARTASRRRIRAQVRRNAPRFTNRSQWDIADWAAASTDVRTLHGLASRRAAHLIG